MYGVDSEYEELAKVAEVCRCVAACECEVHTWKANGALRVDVWVDDSEDFDEVKHRLGSLAESFGAVLTSADNVLTLEF